MSNQGKNNNNNTEGRDYSYKTLIQGCTDTLVSLNQNGAVFLETSTQIADTLTDIISNTFGIDEIDRVFIDIDADNKTKRVLSAHVLLCFIPTEDSQHIRRYGSGSQGGGRNVIDGIRSARSGAYQLSDHFKEFIGSLLPENALDDNKFPIYEHPKNRRLACVEVDIDAVISLILNIDETSPYAANILFADQIDVREGIAEYSILFTKTIDLSSGRKRKNRKNNNINYTAIGEAFSGSNRNGGRNNNHNNHNNNNYRGNRGRR